MPLAQRVDVEGSTREGCHGRPPPRLQRRKPVNVDTLAELVLDAARRHQELAGERVGLLLLNGGSGRLVMHDHVAEFVGQTEAGAISRSRGIDQEQWSTSARPDTDSIQIAGVEIPDETTVALKNSSRPEMPHPGRQIENLRRPA